MSTEQIIKQLEKDQQTINIRAVANLFANNQDKELGLGAINNVNFVDPLEDAIFHLEKNDKKDDDKKDDKQKSAQWVIAQPKPGESSYSKNALHGRILLRARKDQKNTPPLLLHEHLYTEINGRSVSIKAQMGDLHTYLNQNDISNEQKKKFMALILLQIEALHARGLAHRDLKEENIFLFLGTDGEPFPVLADLDTIVSVNQYGQMEPYPDGNHPSLAGSPYFFSPTLELAEERKENQFGVLKNYCLLAPQADDVYAYGVMLRDKKIPGMDGIVKAAMTKNHSERPTIATIKRHPAWGGKSFWKDREAELAAYLKRPRHFGGHFRITPSLELREGDAFNLLSNAVERKESKYIPGMKDIVYELERLKNKMSIFKIKSAFDKDQKSDIDQYEYQAITRNKQGLLNHINQRFDFLNSLQEQSNFQIKEELAQLKEMEHYLQKNLANFTNRTIKDHKISNKLRHLLRTAKQQKLLSQDYKISFWLWSLLATSSLFVGLGAMTLGLSSATSLPTVIWFATTIPLAPMVIPLTIAAILLFTAAMSYGLGRYYHYCHQLTAEQTAKTISAEHQQLNMPVPIFTTKNLFLEGEQAFLSTSSALNDHDDNAEDDMGLERKGGFPTLEAV